MNAKNEMPGGSAPPGVATGAGQVIRPKIGDIVHYYDETRANSAGGVLAQRAIGVGPYAAIVVAYDLQGLILDVRAPHGGVTAERVVHRRELPRDVQTNELLPGKKRWWQHKAETK